MTSHHAAYDQALALHRAGQLVQAKAMYESALASDPGHFKATHLLGVLYSQTRDLAQAERYLARATEIDPQNDEAWCNLGLTLKELGRVAQAEVALRRAVAVNPRLVRAWQLLAVIFKEAGMDGQADIAQSNAILIDPENALYRFQHAIYATRRAPVDTADAAAVAGSFAKRLGALKAWADAKPERYGHLRACIGRTQPFFLAYRKGNHAPSLSLYGDILTLAAKAAGAAKPSHRIRDGRIRLLIVSGYVCDHSVWQVVIKGLVAHLDRTRFELCLYHVGTRHDAETDWAKARADLWRDTATVNSQEGWLAQAQADAPDVIYFPEVGMDPTSVFLAAHRVAPLQAVGWGHPVTSGLKTVDLFLSGDLIEPSDAAAHYRETLIRLPGTGCCTLAMDIVPRLSLTIAAALPPPGVARFIVAQQPFKFDPDEADLLAQIAQKTGRCVFLFPQPTYAEWAFDRVLQAVRRAFAARGLDSDLYIRPIPWAAGRVEFYGLLTACDVFLDLPNFSGYTTAWQAAHCGLPIVTLQGPFMRQRLAAALLRQIGQPDTIASSPAAYVEIAAMLAMQAGEPAARERRASLRAAAALADNRIAVVRAFETALANELTQRLAQKGVQDQL